MSSRIAWGSSPLSAISAPLASASAKKVGGSDPGWRSGRVVDQEFALELQLDDRVQRAVDTARGHRTVIAGWNNDAQQRAGVYLVSPDIVFGNLPSSSMPRAALGAINR